MNEKWKAGIRFVAAAAVAAFICGIASAWAEERFGWPRRLTVSVSFFATALLLFWVAHYRPSKR